MAAQLWSLPKERVKNAKAHSVPLSPQAMGIIEGMPRIEACPYVFSANGKTSVTGFSKIKRRLDASLPADMAPWRLHDIRRSTATGLARIGVDIIVVEKILNHVSGQLKGVVGTYQRHGFEDERRVALERWADHVGRLVSGAEAPNVLEFATGRAGR